MVNAVVSHDIKRQIIEAINTLVNLRDSLGGAISWARSSGLELLAFLVRLNERNGQGGFGDGGRVLRQPSGRG